MPCWSWGKGHVPKIRSVVVTGIGLVTPLGWTRESIGYAISHGRSAVRVITEFEPVTGGPVSGAIVRHFQAGDHISDRRATRDMTRPTRFGVAASAMAVADAGLDVERAAERMGIF